MSSTAVEFAARHLAAHAKLAEECQVGQGLAIGNGSLVRLKADGAEILEHVHVGRIGLDGKALLPLDSEVMRVRHRTIWNGSAVVSLAINRRGDLLGEPQVTVHGLLNEAEHSDELAALRNRTVGFVFQFHHLLREFSALENVMMPLRIAGRDRAQSRARALELLARVGLSHRVDHRPAELSGGEQQRTAVARALAIDPAVFLADEPSGNLDHANAESLHDLLSALARDLEIAMVVVTHNRALARRADRVLQMENGVLREADLQGVVA